MLGQGSGTLGGGGEEGEGKRKRETMNGHSSLVMSHLAGLTVLVSVSYNLCSHH